MKCPKCGETMAAAYTGETKTMYPPLRVWRRECVCGNVATGHDGGLGQYDIMDRECPKDVPDYVYVPMTEAELHEKHRQFARAIAAMGK